MPSAAATGAANIERARARGRQGEQGEQERGRAPGDGDAAPIRRDAHVLHVARDRVREQRVRRLRAERRHLRRVGAADDHDLDRAAAQDRRRAPPRLRAAKLWGAKNRSQCGASSAARAAGGWTDASLEQRACGALRERLDHDAVFVQRPIGAHDAVDVGLELADGRRRATRWARGGIRRAGAPSARARTCRLASAGARGCVATTSFAPSARASATIPSRPEGLSS